MGDAFLIVSEAGVIEYASPDAARTFGYVGRALEGRPLSEVLRNPEGGDPTQTAYWLQASTAPRLEGLHGAGRPLAVRVRQQEVRGAGRPHYVLFLENADIPAAPEEIFSRHQELYELATRQGRISVWEVDYRTNHFKFSPVLALMLGLADTEVPTTVEGWIPLFYPEDWQALEIQTQRVLLGELPEISTECRMRHVDGRVLWTLVRGQVSFDETGRPVKMVGTSIDITDRKKAEAERDLFFTLSLDLLSIADIRGFFRRVNPAFTKALGYAAEELTSKPFFDFVHPDDQEMTREALAGLREGKDVVAFENRYRCKDGSWRWLSWTCPGVLPGSDTVYAIARDVTDARRVHAELERAKQEAETANRAKSEFLSRMSHELRTPLNAILGFGQLLQREPFTPRQRGQIDMIVKGGRHLLNLINEVLDIAKIEVGRLDLSMESVDLTELTQEVVSLTQPMAEQRGITVTVEEATLAGRNVAADKQRLKQVLLNLISNAIKYNRDQGQVRIFGAAVAGSKFRLAITDTGPGIPHEKQERLFTPFDRLGAESTPIEGSGLGLVLSKHLTELMGGQLGVDSRPGQGSTFSVTLTLHRGQPATAPPHLVPAATTAPPQPPRTILYIEDNLANVRLVEAVLTYRPGIRLLTAMQGGLGVELARQHHPDLILLDVHLPDIMGYDLLTLMRADPQLRAIPILVISADATAPQIARLREVGAQDYLTKPIDVEQFLRALDRYLPG